MKCTVLTSVIVLCVMLACPLHLLKEPTSATVPTATDIKEIAEITESPANTQSFSVLIDGEVRTLSRKDYICGVVAAEMPALYETEALKAQAVAAYTFACYRASTKGEREYDITTDSKTDQAYTSDQAAREKWGEKAEEYLSKIDAAVSAVDGQLLTYNGKCALSVYHAISSGTTAACRDVWGKDLPYLTEVSSIGDRLDDGYLSSAEFSADDLKERLSPLATATGDAADWFKNLQVAASKRVVSLDFCGTTLGGGQLAEALALRSANFEIAYKDGVFIFTVMGYGHGVGMSQIGANYMAKQGSDYKEILLHYYKGCEIKNVS